MGESTTQMAQENLKSGFECEDKLFQKIKDIPNWWKEKNGNHTMK